MSTIFPVPKLPTFFQTINVPQSGSFFAFEIEFRSPLLYKRVIGTEDQPDGGCGGFVKAIIGHGWNIRDIFATTWPSIGWLCTVKISPSDAADERRARVVVDGKLRDIVRFDRV